MKFQTLLTAELAATLGVACAIELDEESTGAPDTLELNMEEPALAAPASKITANLDIAGDRRAARLCHAC